MRVLFRVAALVACLVAPWSTALAQTLSVSVRPPLPNQLGIGDPWSLDVLNGSGAALRVAFHARVTEASAGLVFDATSAVVEIAPGAHALDARRLAPITVASSAPAIASQLGRLASFPDGDYTICVEALPEGGGAPLGEGCFGQRVATVLPPILIGPYKGTAITDPLVVWSWFMQPNARGGAQVVCDLTVAEILPNQTPEEALRRNPPVLVKKDLRASVWQTNEATRQFRSGHTYAWRLVARLGQTNVSESEIWTFTYAAPDPLGQTADALADTASARKYGLTEEHSAPVLAGESDVAPGAEAALGAETAPAAEAEPAPPPRAIEFHTHSRAITEASNRAGLLSSTPGSFARFELDPTLVLYGSPLSLNLLISTEKSLAGSEISRGAFGFQRNDGGGFVLRPAGAPLPTANAQPTPQQLRADSLRQVVGRPASVEQGLESRATLPVAEPTQTVRELGTLDGSAAAHVLTHVPNFAFGSVAPDFSRLTMSGVTMNGGSVQYEPGRIFASLAVGKLQREEVPAALLARPSANGVAPQLFRDVYAGRVGLGRSDGSYLAATGLYARDDGQSRAILSLADTAAGVAPQDNLVLGLAGRSVTKDRRWALDAEANASLFDHDRNGAAITNRPDQGPAAALFGSRASRAGASADWSGAMRGTMATPEGHTKLATGVRFIGPGYVSVGTRGLRTDVLQYDGSLDQALLGGRVTMGAQLAWEKTGVVLPERGQSIQRRFSTRSEVRAWRGSALQLGYTRNDQEQHAAGGFASLAQSTDQLNARVQQSAALGVLRTSSFVTFDLLQGHSGDATGQNRSQSVQLAEMLTHPSQLALFVRASHNRTRTSLAGDVDPRVTMLEGSLIDGRPRLLQSSVGASLTRGEHTRGQGFFLGARARLGGAGALEVRWDYDDITDPVSPGHLRVERTASATLTLGGASTGL